MRTQLIIIIALAFSLVAQSASYSNILKNGGFEGDFIPAASYGDAIVEGSLPEHWEENSGWNAVTAKYSPITSEAYEGTKAFRIDHLGPIGNRIQIYQQIKLKTGKYYQLD